MNLIQSPYIITICLTCKDPRGQEEAPSKTTLPDYDASCYLCPGNKRAAGEANPLYEQPYVFVNDYSAVRDDQEEFTVEDKDGSVRIILGRPKSLLIVSRS